ncbi:hypothetical protein [Ostreibacterium oceani]|uniref:DUF4129 domain-containing protein n=1 Tax=Ostreibacterium oceani TaxID=2654998 RepID=A0A6N7EZZ4_9GAMM|nr:hypothetical protein [Ostreibacterium oceani]MPV86939.1 hypothetical protein [Ostreibacterium oceani]
MNFNQITIDLSARTDAQAANLGFVVARRYKGILLLAYGLAMLPFLLLSLLLLLTFEQNWVAFIALLIPWWFKPYYERVVLFNVSRLIFGQSIGAIELLTSFTQAAKNGLWLNLSLYRLSPSRSATMPVKLLEGLAGREYAERVKFLRIGSPSTGLTIGLVHIEVLIYINCYILLTWLLPDYWLSNFFSNFYLADTSVIANVINLFFYAVAMMTIGVFYTCAGFMLYLNRRIMNEGWSIEMAFKQMAKRFQSIGQMTFMWGVLVVSSILGGVSAGGYALASDGSRNDNFGQSSGEASQTDDFFAEDKALLSDIILDESVNPFEVKGKWVANEKVTDASLNRDKDGFAFEHLEGFAALLRFLLIVASIGGIIWLILRYKLQLMNLLGKKPVLDNYEAPTTLFGLNVSKATLPDDITSEANQLLCDGDIVGALSLLYRGSLVSLMFDYGMVIKESHTEGDCLAMAKKHLSTQVFGYFSQLTQTWQNLVYAHQLPQNELINQLITQWHVNFTNHRDQAMPPSDELLHGRGS